MAFRLVWFWRYELLWPRGFSRRGRRSVALRGHQKRSVAFRPLTRKPYRCLLFHPSGVGHRGTPIMRTGIQYPRNFVPLMYLCRHNFGWEVLMPCRWFNALMCRAGKLHEAQPLSAGW